MVRKEVVVVYFKVMSLVGVDYETEFGLDDWI
jgi:hypothetical protein